MEQLIELWLGTGVAQLSADQGVMLLVGLGLLYLCLLYTSDAADE